MVAVDEPDDVIDHGHVPHYSDQGEFDKIFNEDDEQLQLNRNSAHSARVTIKNNN